MKKWILLPLGATLGLALGELSTVSPAHACDCAFQDYLNLVVVEAEGNPSDVDLWRDDPPVSAIHASSGLYLDKGSQGIVLRLSR